MSISPMLPSKKSSSDFLAEAFAEAPYNACLDLLRVYMMRNAHFIKCSRAPSKRRHL
jgi:hypothetical protein